jgi:hypothetical protein
MTKIVIGSGWWCSERPDNEVNPGRKKGGDDEVRAVDFFGKWLQTLSRVSRHDSIVVVDSASPVKPPEMLRKNVSWVELPFNARHSTNHLGQWSGWLRSVMAAGSYAICAEADYFVYVEQDCLLSGDGIIDHCISNMDRGLMFGSGQGTPQPLQQSFFIVRKDRLPSFLKNLADLKHKDCELSPEWKFVYASCRPLVLASNLGLLKSPRMKRFALRIARHTSYELLPVHGGRARPLRKEDPFYYFQHGSKEELEDFFATPRDKEAAAA